VSTVIKNTTDVFSDKLFNIIIDDGSHRDDHQLKTLENFYKLVKPGGFYIID